MIRIVVYGQPAPQGSKDAFVNRYTGRAQMKESSPNVKPWREAVKHAALTALALDYPGFQRYDEPLIVAMVFFFDRPKGHYRTGRNAHLLRDGAPSHPMGKPDLSKLARSTEDALTDAGVWRDDARVVGYTELMKVYTDPGYLLDKPGAVISIRPFRKRTPAPSVVDARPALDLEGITSA